MQTEEALENNIKIIKHIEGLKGRYNDISCINTGKEKDLVFFPGDVSYWRN